MAPTISASHAFEALTLPAAVAENMLVRIQALEHAERRAHRLLADLADASQIGIGAFTVNKGPTDLAAIARRVVSGQEEAGQRHLTLEIQGERSDVNGEWDEERISQALTKPLSNALKYSPADSEVLVSLEARDDEARVRVVDHGDGLSQEQIPQLFNPISRPHPETLIKGKGLGLSICKGIIEAHDGRIWVESEPEKGCAFCVSLPRRQSAAVTSSETAPSSGAPATDVLADIALGE